MSGDQPRTPCGAAWRKPTIRFASPAASGIRGGVDALDADVHGVVEAARLGADVGLELREGGLELRLAGGVGPARREALAGDGVALAAAVERRRGEAEGLGLGDGAGEDLEGVHAPLVDVAARVAAAQAGDGDAVRGGPGRRRDAGDLRRGHRVEAAGAADVDRALFLGVEVEHPASR